MVQRDIFPVYNLEKLAREVQQLALKKENKIGNPTIPGLIRIEKLWFRPNNNPVLEKYSKISTLDYCICIKPWSTDKIIAFMNHDWWGDIKKSINSAYLRCPTCPKYNPGKPVHTAPGHFKLPNRLVRFGK